MLINKACLGCGSTIEPRFYVQYGLHPEQVVEAVPYVETNATIQNFHVLLSYYEPITNRIIYGQMYDFSCFCVAASRFPEWQLSAVTREHPNQLRNTRLTFPIFNPEHPQNFPRTHFFKYHLFEGIRFQYEQDWALQAIQQNIEADRIILQQDFITWHMRQLKLANHWKNIVEIMHRSFPYALPENARHIFSAENLLLLDLRLIRNIVVITVPFRGQIIPEDQHCLSLLEGVL